MAQFIHTGRGPAIYPGQIDPDSMLDFGIEWGSHFGDGISVSSAAWNVATLSSAEQAIVASYSVDGKTYHNVTMIRLTGFVDGVTYTVRCRATATNGQVDDKSMMLICGEQ